MTLTTRTPSNPKPPEPKPLEQKPPEPNSAEFQPVKPMLKASSAAAPRGNKAIPRTEVVPQALCNAGPRYALLRSGMALLLPALALLILLPGNPAAHPGSLDEYGGHFDERYGTYHYHRPTMDMAHRKREVLVWLDHPNRGVLKGTVARIERPNAVWLHIPYRPAYQELVPLVSKGNRNDKDQLVRIWLLYVSPEETGQLGRKFAEWFDETVIFELKNKLANKEVTVQFQRLGGNAQRMRGMVFLGEENVNLWMVLQGWSYYVLEEDANPADAQFRKAEDLARTNKAGVWAHIK